MKKLFLLLFLFSCTDKKTAQEKAEAAVKKYIKQNAHDPSSYKPLSFGKLDSVYARDTGNYYQLDARRKMVVLKYNDAKNKGMTSRADSLKTELLEIDNQMNAGKFFTGLRLYHVSQGKNELGEMVMNRGSFYLDSNFEVKEFVMTEDSLMKANE
jgi:hypothetical protein